MHIKLASPQLAFAARVAMTLTLLLPVSAWSISDPLTCQSLYTGPIEPSLPWLDPSEPEVRPITWQALDALRDSHTHGLDPTTYEAQELTSRAQTLASAMEQSPPDAKVRAELIQFNHSLTRALACYLQQLRNGQLEPELIHPRAILPPSHWKAANALRQAWSDERIGQLINNAVPQATEYRLLRQALARYRSELKEVSASRARHLRQQIVKIELSMERLRWLPKQLTANRIVVNIPQFSLRLDDARQTKHWGRAVVGRPGYAATPMMVSTLDRIELNPTWYIPQSIVRRDFLPEMRKRASFLSDQGLTIVRRDGRRENAVTKELLELLERGKARLEQKPGRLNAMGRVKFVTPNHRQILLHDTNRPHLFKRTTRTYSNGCVWVENPVELVAQLIRSPKRLKRLMASGRTRIVRPGHPTQVVLTYQTAIAHESGSVTFFPDVYGYDALTIEHLPRWSREIHNLKPSVPLIAARQKQRL